MVTISKVTIFKYSYLKTPKYKWTLENSVGGSFSNSGQYDSLKRCVAALKSQYPAWTFKTAELVDVYDFDSNDIPQKTKKTISLEDK